MRIYIRSYKDRGKWLLLAVAIVIALLLGNGLLFQGKAEKITRQISSYNKADYSTVYILNYDTPLNNECIFVDTDVMLYKDSQKSRRIAASAFMSEPGTRIDLEAIKMLTELEPNHIIISANVAEEYEIQAGDVLFADFSYSSETHEYRVDSIVGTDFDMQNPNIDNNIGIVYMGYDEEYHSRTQCHYALFSNRSKADELSEYPQVIRSIINKDENQTAVFKQGIAVLIITALVSVVTIVLSDLVFFKKSRNILMRCYLKGMKKTYLSLIPAVEKIVLYLMPIIISEGILMQFVPCNSIFTELLYGIPAVAGIAYIVISFGMELHRGRRQY